MTQPTVGRVMYYRPHASDVLRDNMMSVDGEPLAAIVAAVQNEKYLNLTVSDSNGNSFSRTSVPFFETQADGPVEGGFVHWMPYQLAQAVRHAADPTFAPVTVAVKPLNLSAKASSSNG